MSVVPRGGALVVGRVILTATVLAFAILAALVAMARPASAAAVSTASVPAVLTATNPVPYTDPQSTGYLTFYDKSGSPVGTGNINDKPFVWKSVSSQPAAAPYNGAGRKATLLAYQPRTGAPSAQWSGDTMTASTTYPDVAHPTAQATATDFSLRDFLEGFPPQWDGLIQLRMYLGVPNHSTLTASYVSTDIRVTGQVWAVVGGGPGAGPGGANIAGARSGAGTATGPADQPVTTADGGSDRNPVAAILPGIGTSGTLAIAAAALIALVLVGLLWRRRRSDGDDSDQRAEGDLDENLDDLDEGSDDLEDLDDLGNEESPVR